MITRKRSVAFSASCVVFFWIVAGGISYNNSSFAENNKKNQNTKVKFMPDLKNWPSASQEAAREMLQKYGLPDEATEHTLLWYNNGPWKYTRISDRESKHLFPFEHSDVLEQAIDYKVPLNRYSDIALYNGSITMKRTDGELSSRCDQEAANFLSINLANNIAIGKMSVKEAKDFHASAMKNFILNGNACSGMQAFQFAVSKGKTMDGDRPGIADEEHELVLKKIKEINREAKDKEKLSLDNMPQ
jgi:hypothetical protein